MWSRRNALIAVPAAIATAAMPRRPAAAAPETVLRVACTFADIPLTTGQASQGGEGQRFIGYQLYDALINWDLSRADVVAPLRPGLATAWTVDDATKTVWTFTLRQGVRFHDGTPFNADAVLFNLAKLMDKDAPQFDPAQAAQGTIYMAPLKSARKIDDFTVEITAKRADAVIPYQIANVTMSGPANWERLGRDWNRVASQPAGTGPWKLDRLVPRTRAELVRNADYWDKARIPKVDRQILLPVPDPNTRVAALLSGQVDWVEAPPPDALDRLRASGMQVMTNKYPHIWPYILSYEEGSPMLDLRVRKAVNLAIDRDGIVELLGGTAMPAKGMVSGPPLVRQPVLRHQIRPGRSQGAVGGGRLRTAEAAETAIRHVDLRLRADAAGPDERFRAAEYGRRGHQAGLPGAGVGGAARSPPGRRRGAGQQGRHRPEQ